MESASTDQISWSRYVSTGETVETIAAMCHQELTGYYVDDYIICNVDKFLDVDRDCRKKMVAWSYQVIDFCKFSRETVEIAMSNLDRFLSTNIGLHALQDRSVYQLAAMTTLYTAVKINEPEAMDPALVSSLSRGTYSSREIEDMEFIIIQSLQWRLNPPTTLSFIREFMKLITFEALDNPTRKVVYELSKYQAEYATSNHDFVGVKSSEKAYHSFMNALDCLDIEPKIIQYIAAILQNAIGIVLYPGKCGSFIKVQDYLYSALAQHPKVRENVLTLSPKRRKNWDELTSSISPRSSISIDP
jgi:hypothetical protein